MNEQESREDDRLIRARELGYEPRDISLRGVMTTGVALLLLVVGSMALMWWLVGVLAKDEPRGLSEQQNPATRREQHVNQQLMRIANERDQRRVLNTYGWVDRQTKVARVPIHRAISILSARGNLELTIPPATPEAGSDPKKAS